MHENKGLTYIKHSCFNKSDTNFSQNSLKLKECFSVFIWFMHTVFLVSYFVFDGWLCSMEMCLKMVSREVRSRVAATNKAFYGLQLA